MDGASADGFQIRDESFTEEAGYFLNNIKQLSEKGKYKLEAKKVANGINENFFPKAVDI